MTDKEKTKQKKIDKAVGVTEILKGAQDCVYELVKVLYEAIEYTNNLIDEKLKEALGKEKLAPIPIEAFRRELEATNYETRVLYEKLVKNRLALDNIAATYVRTIAANLDKEQE